MNSLEFIDKEIKKYKNIIIGVKATLKEPKTEDVIKFLKNDLKEYEEKVLHLQQIKSKLEAWEVVKHLIHKRKMCEERFIQVMGGVYNEGQCWSSGINPYEIIKKALEVEDER